MNKEFFMNKKMQKWVLGGFALATAVFIVVAGCVNASDALPETRTGTQSETETIAEPKGLLRLSFGTVEVENIASREVTVYIPYSAGFNPAALDVTAELEEGAAMMPVIKGPQDFSKPKKIQVRTADGVISDYTITVYALFSGIESLPDLAAYTNWNEDTGGTARMPDQNKPFYIALEEIPLHSVLYSDYPAFAAFVESSPWSPWFNGVYDIFGVEEDQSHRNLPGYTNGQYLVLDLSRYTDVFSIMDADTGLPLGQHLNDSMYFADGPFSRVVSIKLPPNLQVLGASLFQGNEVITSIELPEGLQKVCYSCFGGASNLTSVTLPSTLRTIGAYAFMNTSLESVNFPQGLRKIGSGAFAYTNIKTVTLPSSVMEVEASFSNNPLLEYADFSSSSIDRLSVVSGGFSGCGNLKEVYLPETLLGLGMFSRSFNGAKLEKMVVYASTPPDMELEYKSSNKSHVTELWELSGPYFMSSAFKIYVPDASVTRYKNASGPAIGWSEYADRIHPLSELEGAAP
jgi:hypothetical protein